MQNIANRLKKKTIAQIQGEIWQQERWKRPRYIFSKCGLELPNIIAKLIGVHCLEQKGT